MRTVQFTTWERITLLGCIPSTCIIVEIPKYLKIVEILTLTEAEGKLVNLTQLPNGGSTWTNTKHTFSLDLEKADFRFLMQLVKARKMWPTSELTLQLLDKLEDVAAQPAMERKHEEAN